MCYTNIDLKTISRSIQQAVRKLHIIMYLYVPYKYGVRNDKSKYPIGRQQTTYNNVYVFVYVCMYVYTRMYVRIPPLWQSAWHV